MKEATGGSGSWRWAGVFVATCLLWLGGVAPTWAGPAQRAATVSPLLGKLQVATTPASTLAAVERAPAPVAATVPAAPAAQTNAAERTRRLHAAVDRLGLNAAAALVVDQDTGEELYAKNADAVLPVASLTKLMTGLVLANAALPLDTPITITSADIDRLKNSSSRLPVGTTLPRGELLQLALMSSENRAAHALGRTFPGGLARFVKLMNVHAQLLGMNNTRFVEPTGLSALNQSSARDLARLVAVASEQALLRLWTTSLRHDVSTGKRIIPYRNTNALLWDKAWEINLQKTGYIREAGRCLVMQTELDGRRLIMIFLDSDSGQTRLADARRVREWVALGQGAENYAFSH